MSKVRVDRIEDRAGGVGVDVPALVQSAGLEGKLSDLTDPLKGASILGHGTVSVQTIADLLLFPRRTDLRYQVAEYTAGTGVGGGQFYWDSSSTATANGGTVFQVSGVSVGRFKRTTAPIFVDEFGAVPGNTVSQRTAIELADAAAVAIGAPLCFRGGATYYADELFLKSRVILGEDTKLIKTTTTTQGFFNWGNKPAGIVDGLVRGFIIDANGKDNVVNFRIYGNHTRSKVRDLVLKDCDFYALSYGGLTSQGDKDDVFDGLDIDGVYIASERGNTALATTYSFGLEIFPGSVCKNLRVRNVRTYGKIINKIHWVDGLDLDDVNFKASAIFDSLSSGYCEINNCKNAVIGPNSTFDTGGNGTYYALVIGGARIVGGQAVTEFYMGGKVNGRMGIPKVADLQMTADFRCTGQVDMYDVCGRIGFKGGSANSLRTVNSAGSIARLEISGGFTLGGGLRLEFAACPVAELIVGAAQFNLSTDQLRLQSVTYGVLKGSVILCRGAPLPYVISAKDSNITLNDVYIDGGGTWDRPIYCDTATGVVRMIKCTVDRMVSSTLLASGSAALAVNNGSVINGV